MAKPVARSNPATIAYEQGLALLAAHPIFSELCRVMSYTRNANSRCPSNGWVQAHLNTQSHSNRYRPNTAQIDVHPKRLASPEEWAYCLGRATLGFAFELFQRDRSHWAQWSAACDVVTARFIQTIKLGRPPEGMELPEGLPQRDEAQWYTQFCEQGIPAWAEALSLAGPGVGGAHPSLALPEQWPEPEPPNSQLPSWRRQSSWSDMFAAGLARSVTQSVEIAAGVRSAFGQSRPASSALERARHWFMDSFPLLASMVAAFDIIEDARICEREEISVAAVDEVLRTIYINPGPRLSEQELRFVIAHEVLHVALRHLPRRRGREPFLWNVACDFVINDWLIQMDVGQAPGLGLLHDADLRGLSAEEVYDRIASDLRRMRKLRTLAGGQGDMLERRVGDLGSAGNFTDIDEFCRTQLGKGLLRHEQSGRGLLPAGLIEEIRALLQPPIDWQVELARWFDHHFPPIETRRSYARISRRQSATPDIPRPRIQADSRWLEGRTFGVVLDTSGSMDRHVLAKALGAIASYAEAKDVPAVRLICCDAAAYDLGYLPAADIAQRIALKGRGGTVLQPGIDLLQHADDFPKAGPILIITDGDCDMLRVPREHAYLLAPGRRLPFRTTAPIFAMS
jgi:predicted metal-dependent peptidase